MPDKCTYGWNFSKIQKPLCSEDVPIYETKEKQKCLKNSQNHHHKGATSPLKSHIFFSLGCFWTSFFDP